MSLKPFLQTFGIIAVILSLFPFVAADFWWIRMFDYPHVQLTTLTFVALMVYFIRFDFRSWKDYGFIVVLGACFLLQLTKIYPYTPLASIEINKNERVEPSNSISILSSNVLQKNDKYQKVVDEVLTRNPDLLVFTETNIVWRDELRKRLQKFDYINRLEMPLDNTYGMILYSKFPLKNKEIRFLLEDSIPSMHMKVILPSGKPVELHIIHPTPPMPPHDKSSTDRDAQMMMVAKMAKNSELPVIVAGDFNDVAWSESTSLFQNVSGLLDPRIGRGFYNTYNVNSWLMRWPLDHLFVSEHFKLIEIERGNDVGSDHFPLYVKLSLEPQLKENQEKEPPTAEELKEAEKQIEKEEEKDAKEKSKGKN